MSYLIVANWKMNKTNQESLELITEINNGIHQASNVKVVICPPFTSIVSAAEVLQNSPISLGSQNLSHELPGAYTGEISAEMIAPHCEYVILGHSERRMMYGETSSIVNMKILKALDSKLIPIICIGENIDQRNEGKLDLILKEMLESSLMGINKYDNFVIAYEPLWAIGTGISASPDQANDVCNKIKKLLMDYFGKSSEDITTPILYGGSVSEENIKDFLEQDCIDGALIGSASLNSEQFLSIIQTIDTL